MNIILATEVIHPGGAETFVLRLSQAFHSHGNKVSVFIFYNSLLNYNLCKLLAPEVDIVPANIPFEKVLGKVDGLLFRLGLDVSVRSIYIKRSLKRLIKRQNTDVIHSHLLKSDTLCLDVAKDSNIPVVNTIHGDYLQFFNKTRDGIAIPLLNYHKKAKNNLEQLAGVVCISEKQLSFFKEQFNEETSDKLYKIYNGYTSKVSEDPTEMRKRLNLTEQNFVFGMVSRGIPDKGWEVAIKSFLLLDDKNAHLVLVGNSEFLNNLKEEYKSEQNIHFTGHSDNPVDWINIFTVGLLPTTYPSESLPTVIIEYLFCGIPVVASNAGEIELMTGQGTTPAGLIVPIEDSRVDVGSVARAMKTYTDDRTVYTEHKKNAVKCYEMFDMDKCVDSYVSVYTKAQDNKAKTNN